MLNLAQYYQERHQPDILDCIANLSNDEVFTPPGLADKILDLLPTEVWSNPDLTFFDPATKTGIFLRQIAARLMEGLKEVIPDDQERREHIFKKQLYAMAITELTGHMARRSVYYSKRADGERSVVKFNHGDGNIIYNSKSHTFTNKKCIYCGQVSEGGISDRQAGGALETHAYEFIHLTKEEVGNMKFDVIVGNPPYQLGDGGYGASAMPIYQKFVEQAKLLKPRYMAFIIPSRWFAGGKGLDGFRSDMLRDKRIRELVDYPNASDCFPGVEIKGGVSYFIWDSQYDGHCTIRTILGDEELPTMKRPLDEYDTFIRFNQAIPILRKVQARHEVTLDRKVSSMKPFGLRTFFKDFDNIQSPDKAKVYARGAVGYMSRAQVKVNASWIDKHKVLLAMAAEGGGDYPNKVIGQPILADPPSICTETYLVVSMFDHKDEAINFEGYVKTRFFRFLVMLKKNTQHLSKDRFSFVPDLPMSEVWTDKKLYDRYGIDTDEQAFIESMVKEMS